jgi:hypothetical protein
MQHRAPASASSSAAGRHADRVAGAEIAPQPLVEQLRIVADQRVGRTQDAHARPVVLLELDDLELRIVARQRREVVERRATPAIDRLVVVAHARERRRRTDQRAQQPVLRRIGVLVFVDQHVRARACQRDAALPSLSSKRQRPHDEVVEVDGLVGASARRSSHTRAPRRASSSSAPRKRRRRRVSAFFHALIRHCAARARPRSAVATSSATIASRSAGSKIEKPGVRPQAFASLRRICKPSA